MQLPGTQHCHWYCDWAHVQLVWECVWSVWAVANAVNHCAVEQTVFVITLWSAQFILQ